MQSLLLSTSMRKTPSISGPAAMMSLVMMVLFSVFATLTEGTWQVIMFVLLTFSVLSLVAVCLQSEQDLGHGVPWAPRDHGKASKKASVRRAVPPVVGDSK